MFQLFGPAKYFATDTHVIALPEPGVPHLATVKDRTRNSGLTSVRFVDKNHCIAADFGNKRCYLIDLRRSDNPIVDQHSTVSGDGMPVETDLLDYHKGRFIVSNFYQGTFSLFRIENERIIFEREIAAGHTSNLHGLRFVPGNENLVWLTFCNRKEPCHKVIDLSTGKILHEIRTEQQCQDVAFARGFAVVFARTDHISKGEVILEPQSRKNTIFATAYIYRMPANLTNDPPELVHVWKGEGHLDACKEAPDGRIFSANQYLDRIDIFKLNGKGRLSLTGYIEGFSMPHGLDILGDHLAVTNYGDQTLRIMDLPH